MTRRQSLYANKRTSGVFRLAFNYVEDFFSTIDPAAEDPVLQSWKHMVEYPADWLSYCYANGVTPEEAAVKTGDKKSEDDPGTTAAGTGYVEASKERTRPSRPFLQSDESILRL